MGRPLTENSIMTAFRISPALLERIEAFAEDEEVPRSEMLRRVLEAGADIYPDVRKLR